MVVPRGAGVGITVSRDTIDAIERSKVGVLGCMGGNQKLLRSDLNGVFLHYFGNT